MTHATRGGECRQEGGECGYYHLHRKLNKALLRHRLSIHVAAVAASVASGVAASSVLRAILAVLNLAAVARGHTLQHVAVLVETGNLNRGILQLVLHVRVGSEDDAAHANQVGLYVLQILYRLRTVSFLICYFSAKVGDPAEYTKRFQVV